jgi:hypothetical protein
MRERREIEKREGSEEANRESDLRALLEKKAWQG